MKIMVCCEGQTDIGPITEFIKNTLPSLDLEIDCRTHIELQKIRLLKSELPKGFKKESKRLNRIAYIRRLWHEANKANSNCLGYHQDLDHRDINQTHQDIHSEFNEILPSFVKRIAIIPKETIESWLLSDVTAINSLGDGSVFIDQSPNPEDLWGDPKDKNSNHPKSYLIRNLEKLNVEYNSDTIPNKYTQIAEKTDPNILKRRCPISFGQFHTDIQTFIPKVSTP